MKYWTTYDGRQIKYREIETPHLINIIRDGYRNPNLKREATKRGLPYPPLEKHDYFDLVIFVESISSCAIEGIKNPSTDRIIKLFEAGETEEAFGLMCVLLNRQEYDDFKK